MSIICLYAFVLLFVTIHSQSYDDENILDDQLLYRSEIIPVKPKVIKTSIKSTVTLTCSHESSIHRSHTKWQFKPCSSDFKGISCEQFHENAFYLGNRDRWIKVHAKNARLHKYSYNLDIVNASRSNNGLYRCIANNQIQDVYEVIVSEFITNNEKMSKIVINPRNITIPTNSELVIRCSVNNPSSIMWFRETDANGYDIMYDGHYYSKLSTTVYPNHVLESTEYQSKLSIRKTSLSDSGVYVCVGVNEDSIKTEVNVVTVIGYAGEAHTSFSLLFLIPLAFALVPITVWLCFQKINAIDFVGSGA
ncbi:hypothetical protein Trydic_g11256 [Trypoxylus dichotomus]